ncbi:Rab GTPase-activating protein 1-like [Lachnellula arida]|uniref:Rab GTPase-activating protein 1-like n=1 Tax=Lachnellula arida TaxID=1316785 RepID=A0A8T9B9Y9_9HELO|nr:Rab GTPase-activating protein 1-like [Lachnellula arida]
MESEQHHDGAGVSPVSPIEKNNETLAHDSMVTVRLSEPAQLPALTVDTNLQETTRIESAISEENIEIEEDTTSVQTPDIPLDDVQEEQEEEQEESPRITMMDPNGNEVESPIEPDSERQSRRGSESTEASEAEEVNWEELEKTEENEPRNESSDDSTALLLARLEQENNMLATNPKSGIAKVQVTETQRRRQSRPPSMQHLKRLVNGPTPSALRYSMVAAPPMTDLEFYAALVQDYTRTAQYLPTLLSKKIRSGVPPPLRGVVWQSMSGARDRLLEDQFDRLCGESSPYEGIIGKDLGRSFPGVEMFRDPEGDGQQMLGRVLKCFSLYDHKIGYCQGLGFLVGPLLMHMGDKQAFCVLVRLMEHYDLRNCFLPDLSGLHVRIHQFSELLKQHLPTLSAHLAELQIEPGYVSQWFLSFFAVTCPLPMLFRIYDVIFAEGASETIMRVALSLMRKNEQKILACSEFEDVMQLLLSRGLWDVYHYNADEFVNDFVSLTGVVTHDSLQALEQSFKAGTVDTTIPSDNIGTVASRFLGRLWAGSNSSTKSANLSPGLAAPSRPRSFLRRSPSKQSLASTLNSMEGGASDSMMSASTDATSMSRDSSNADSSSLKTQSVLLNASKQNKDKDLHGQIEDLLTALSEMQRDHSILANQLQREREEREEDRQAVKSLLDGLRKKASSETVNTSDSGESLETVKPVEVESEKVAFDNEDEDSLPAESPNPEEPPAEDPAEDPEDSASQLYGNDLSALLDVVEERFSAPVNNRRSSMMQSKSQLREELMRSKEQLIIEVSKTQDLSRRLSEQHQEVSNLQDQLRESHSHIRNAHSEKQRLEKQIHSIRARQSVMSSTPDSSKEAESEWPQRASNGGGLRQLKLGRTSSQKTPTFNKRTSSLINNPAVVAKEIENQNLAPNIPIETAPAKPDVDVDVIILELVQAKTAEAVARQEAEEYKAKLESLKKLLGMGSGDSPGIAVHRPSPSVASIDRGVATSLGGYLNKSTPKVEAAPASANTTTGGFWGGWGKRTVSGGGEKPAV